MSNKLDNRDWLGLCIFGGLAGGLIWFGVNGTFQAACLGTGVGLLAPIVIVLFLTAIGIL